MTRRALALTLGLSLTAAAPLASPQVRTDCTRWIAEYRAGVLQQKAHRALRRARRSLRHPHNAMTAHHLRRHRMGPLEALRQFQIDCGEMTDTPTTAGLLPPVDVPAPDSEVQWPEFGPPIFAFPPMKTVDLESTPFEPDQPDLPVFGIAPVYPPLGGIGPVGVVPVNYPTGPVVPVTNTPEVGSVWLFFTGVCLMALRKACR